MRKFFPLPFFLKLRNIYSILHFALLADSIMEDQSNQENPGRPTSGVSHHQFPIPKVAIAASSGRNGSHRTCLPKLTHHNYVEYLSESSTYNLPKTSTEFMMKSSYLPVGNISDGYGVSGTDRNFFYSDDPGKACSFKTIGSSSNDLDISKVSPLNKINKSYRFK